MSEMIELSRIDEIIEKRLKSRAGQVWRWKKLLQPTASAERLRAVPPAPDLDAVPPAREPP